jgi:hypothetical protein
MYMAASLVDILVARLCLTVDSTAHPTTNYPYFIFRRYAGCILGESCAKAIVLHGRHGLCLKSKALLNGDVALILTTLPHSRNLYLYCISRPRGRLFPLREPARSVCLILQQQGCAE